MKKIAFCLMFAVSGAAVASDTWFEVSGVSKHLQKSTYTWKGETKKFNETNIGLGLAKEVHDNVELKVGFYENSYNKTSKYAAGFVHANMTYGDFKVKPGVVAGVVTGYDETPELANKVQPIAYAVIAVEYKSVRVNVGYLPSRLVGGNTDVATIQFGFKF